MLQYRSASNLLLVISTPSFFLNVERYQYQLAEPIYKATHSLCIPT
jgi:hypothetical protein